MSNCSRAPGDLGDVVGAVRELAHLLAPRQARCDVALCAVAAKRGIRPAGEEILLDLQ